MKTQVAIIGAGPAGMLLSALLDRAVALHSIVLERAVAASMCCRASVPACWNSTTVDVLRANGLADRMDREGHAARWCMRIVWAGRDSFLIDTQKVLSAGVS